MMSSSVLTGQDSEVDGVVINDGNTVDIDLVVSVDSER